MGQKRHEKRKRNAIDLNSLSKKQRKIYRQRKYGEGKAPATDKNDAKNEASIEEPAMVEDIASLSSDEEETPYKQLISTLVPPRTSFIENSDDSESEEEGNKKEVDSTADGTSETLYTHTHSQDTEHPSGDEDIPDISEDDGSESEEELLDGDDGNDEFHDKDPFLVHFERELAETTVEELSTCKACQREEVKLPHIGRGIHQWYTGSLKVCRDSTKRERDLAKLHVKQNLTSNVATINQRLCGVTSPRSDKDLLTPFQLGLFGILNDYQDVLYTEKSSSNGEEIRLTYCLHALNHVLKTRKRVISHNTKLKQKTSAPQPDEEYRDQGLTRPKVLIVLPFRESAKRVVDMFIQLLNPTDQSFVANKKRFFQEYGLAPEDAPKKGRKPEDFESTFAGNIDDHFRIGIGVAKKTLKLYTKFYSADIILASPLGLRTLIGSEGDRERDYDFLSSIELFILDEADVIMMQNWDHITHLVNHLHLQPQESHDVDFSRVRMWTLNGWAKYYRQNMIFSSVPLPEVTALFNRHCHNYSGKVQIVRPASKGTICQIAVQLPQVFHRVDSISYGAAPDDRFDFFIKKILPHHKDRLMSQTFIFIPSYFDFVRLRNYFKREDINFVPVSEYSKEKSVNTARGLFYHGKVPFMLYTERFHFYKRMRMRGIRHIVFYGLPQYAHFYSELCNMLNDVSKSARADNQTCTVLYSKYEAQKLAEIVGTERAGQMLHSPKSVHMFVSGENG